MVEGAVMILAPVAVSTALADTVVDMERAVAAGVDAVPGAVERIVAFGPAAVVANPISAVVDVRELVVDVMVDDVLVAVVLDSVVVVVVVWLVWVVVVAVVGASVSTYAISSGQVQVATPLRYRINSFSTQFVAQTPSRPRTLLHSVQPNSDPFVHAAHSLWHSQQTLSSQCS